MQRDFLTAEQQGFFHLERDKTAYATGKNRMAIPFKRIGHTVSSVWAHPPGGYAYLATKHEEKRATMWGKERK